MTTTATPVRTALEGPIGTALVAVSLAACLVGVLAGLLGGPLWLDEAISVGIARRPVPELLDTLRLDGAPPLYYLVLHGWMSVVGTGTVAVRLLTVLLVPLALALAALLGTRLAGTAGARAAVVVLAALPWTMRYGSETRMYLLVVVLVLAGALALLDVRSAPTRAGVARLALCAGALLLTHYWSLFLLAVVGAWQVREALRGDRGATAVVAGLGLSGLLFLPWLPTFLFQVAHTGAPWATPSAPLDLLETPTLWGAGDTGDRWLLAAVLLVLVAVASRRADGRALAAVAAATLALAWVASVLHDGAYTDRYTAVVVPLVAVAAGLGAARLPGSWPLVALVALVTVGAVTGVRATSHPRATAGGVADAFRSTSAPGDVLLYCPDQLGPPVAREIGPGYRHVVYPTLGDAEIVDWVGYAERNEAASPHDVAARADGLARGRQLFVLKASGYRTFEADDGASDRGDDCDQLLASVTALRGVPEHLFGRRGTTGQQLFRFDAV